MRTVKYQKLSIQNFLSIGNDLVEIDFQNGLNLITGTNIDNPERRNGAGKSSIIEGFYYALFGTTIRDIKKEFIINNVTKGKGRIELLFDVQTESGTNSYKVIRQLKPSAVELYRCGQTDEDISKDSISNTNKYICDLIGSNPVICKSCDILSLSDSVPFMGKKPEEKRKFIEDIFSLEVFGKMLKDLKELVKENKSELSISNAKIDEITNSVTTLTRQFEEQKKQADQREEILNTRRFDLEERIAKLENQRDSIVNYYENPILEENEKLHTAWEKIDKALATIVFDLSEMNKEKILVDNDLKKLSNISQTSCPTCMQNISEDHITHVENEKMLKNRLIESINADIEATITKKLAFQEKKQKIQEKLSSNADKLNHNKIMNEKMEGLESSIESLSKQLDDLDNDIKTESSNLDSFINLITETSERKGVQEEIYNSLKQTSEDLDVCKFILGEEGIKSFLIKRLLDMLNSSIQKYITALGMTMRCKFDEYFDEKITNDKGKDISYWNFSGGERRTVDLACAWAFKDIKKKITGVSSNVEFLDEWADSAWDEKGVDLFMESLIQRIDKNNMCCYLVSHRKEILKHITGEVINLEKENGITRRAID
jgi:DNA repair exonuclease SbcCD ATPase subunit